MANQIQATVYQIDGSPLPSATEISFLTSDIMIKEATLPIAAVNAAIFYYPNTSNKLGSQVFYVSETLSTLLTAANVGSATQVQATVRKFPQAYNIHSQLAIYLYGKISMPLQELTPIYITKTKPILLPKPRIL